MTSFDAIIIGGGHNGLAAATLLAGSGRKTLLLEAAEETGGGLRMEEFAPGFRAPLAPLLNRIHGETIAALDLKRHGLNLGPADLPSIALAPGIAPLILRGPYGETMEGSTAAEANAWQELRALLSRHSAMLRPFLFQPPPALRGDDLASKLHLGRAALRLRRLGSDDMREFLRLMLTNVADLLDEHLEDERLKGLLAFDAVLASHLGPRSPTSLMGLYWRLAGDVNGISGGQSVSGATGSLIGAMQSAALHAGVTVRCASAVEKIRIRSGRACGVTLAGGDEIDARLVVSAINPVTTLLELVGAARLDTGFAARVKAIRMRGNVARLDLALDAPPRFDGLNETDTAGRIVFVQGVDAVERAFNPSKYGEMSDEPVFEFVLPSLTDPALAPDGTAILSANIQFAPHGLKEGWETGGRRLLEHVLLRLEALAPGLRRTIRHARLQSPPDIETAWRMPGGHWHHGELQVDQMLVNRPLYGAERYDTPISGLYLAGAGSHPGGGISGAPGINAARRILQMERA